MQINLSPENNAILLEVLSKHGIDIKPLSADERIWLLSDSDRDIIINAISNEFSASGLLPSSEPNQRGLQLEDLLDRINKFL